MTNPRPSESTNLRTIASNLDCQRKKKRPEDLPAAIHRKEWCHEETTSTRNQLSSTRSRHSTIRAPPTHPWSSWITWWGLVPCSHSAAEGEVLNCGFDYSYAHNSWSSNFSTQLGWFLTRCRSSSIPERICREAHSRGISSRYSSRWGLGTYECCMNVRSSIKRVPHPSTENEPSLISQDGKYFFSLGVLINRNSQFLANFSTYSN